MRLGQCVALLNRLIILNKGNIPSSSVFVSFCRKFSQWDIVGAVCLERKPVITQSLTDLECKYKQYIDALEIEKSYLSDHEKRHNQDKIVVEKMKTGTLEDLDAISNQTAQDFEDACIAEFNKYKPASRKTDADLNNDKKSTQRKLDSSLVFVIKQKLGNDLRWYFPQAVHEDGETLRQTAERALHQIAVCQKIRFMGNAPIGYYKYKYPKAARGNGSCGAKVFFFKAQLLGFCDGAVSVKENSDVSDYMWLTHSELEDVLQPVYFKTVHSFLYPDSFDVEENTIEQISVEDEHMSSIVSQA